MSQTQNQNFSWSKRVKEYLTEYLETEIKAEERKQLSPIECTTDLTWQMCQVLASQKEGEQNFDITHDFLEDGADTSDTGLSAQVTVMWEKQSDGTLIRVVIFAGDAEFKKED